MRREIGCFVLFLANPNLREFAMRYLALILLMLSSQVLAQLYTPTASELTESEAQALFKELDTEDAKMDKFSECFERAHMWALKAEKQHQVTMEKVYLYFTYKFQMRHRVTSRWGRAFTWWFHVAPAVRVNGELWVMDATFTDRAMPVTEWAASLMKDPEVCEELSDPQVYVDERNVSQGYRHVDRVQKQCYFVATPRYFYQPLETGFREINGGQMSYQAPAQVPADWNPATWFWALNSYESKFRKEARRALGF